MSNVLEDLKEKNLCNCSIDNLQEIGRHFQKKGFLKKKLKIYNNFSSLKKDSIIRFFFCECIKMHFGEKK